MKTLALLAVLLGSSIAAAQAQPGGLDEADANLDHEPVPVADAPATDAPAQVTDEDLPPPARVIPARPVDPRALPALAAAEPPAAAEPADDEYILGGRRSTGVAFALSGGTTVAGIVMLALAGSSNVEEDSTKASLAIGGLLALTIGPTTGHMYAGNTWNTGLKVRLASFGIALGAAVVTLAACPPFGGRCNDGVAALGGVTFVGAGITYMGATLYEIVDAPLAAGRYNEKHRSGVAVVPSAGGRLGVSVVGTF